MCNVFSCIGKFRMTLIEKFRKYGVSSILKFEDPFGYSPVRYYLNDGRKQLAGLGSLN
jgi:hypothetical protein